MLSNRKILNIITTVIISFLSSITLMVNAIKAPSIVYSAHLTNTMDTTQTVRTHFETIDGKTIVKDNEILPGTDVYVGPFEMTDESGTTYNYILKDVQILPDKNLRFNTDTKQDLAAPFDNVSTITPVLEFEIHEPTENTMLSIKQS